MSGAFNFQGRFDDGNAGAGIADDLSEDQSTDMLFPLEKC